MRLLCNPENSDKVQGTVPTRILELYWISLVVLSAVLVRVKRVDIDGTSLIFDANRIFNVVNETDLFSWKLQPILSMIDWNLCAQFQLNSNSLVWYFTFFDGAILSMACSRHQARSSILFFYLRLLS